MHWKLKQLEIALKPGLQAVRGVQKLGESLAFDTALDNFHHSHYLVDCPSWVPKKYKYGDCKHFLEYKIGNPPSC